MRRMALGLLVLACGARTALPVPECRALSSAACRQLSIAVAPALVANDGPTWPRVIPRGDGLDLVVGNPGPGTVDIARRLHVAQPQFDVGPAVALDDFAGCPLAATLRELGAQCDDVKLYDDSYAMVEQAQAQPSNVARGPGTFAATKDTFHVAWTSADGMDVAFATVSESGQVTTVASPFAPGVFARPLLTTITCGGVVRSVIRLGDETAGDVATELDVQLANGQIVTMPSGPLKTADQTTIAEWPFDSDAVAVLFRSDPANVAVGVVDENGARTLAQLPSDQGLASLGQIVPMPWGLVVVRGHVDSFQSPVALTVDVSVIDASGQITASQSVPIGALVGGVGWARDNDALVLAWGEPTGVHATAIACARTH